jgi:hypothetical protein
VGEHFRPQILKTINTVARDTTDDHLQTIHTQGPTQNTASMRTQALCPGTGNDEAPKNRRKRKTKQKHPGFEFKPCHVNDSSQSNQVTVHLVSQSLYRVDCITKHSPILVAKTSMIEVSSTRQPHVNWGQSFLLAMSRNGSSVPLNIKCIEVATCVLLKIMSFLFNHFVVQVV